MHLTSRQISPEYIVKESYIMPYDWSLKKLLICKIVEKEKYVVSLVMRQIWQIKTNAKLYSHYFRHTFVSNINPVFVPKNLFFYEL